MSRRSVTVLKGESLLNDAAALLPFGAATSAAHGDMDGALATQLAIAAPGGVPLGIVLAKVMLASCRSCRERLAEQRSTRRLLAVWILAERLALSPVL